MLRTHNCAQIREADIDKDATLCGWVDNRRDHGKLIFIDIRDRFGITQVVFIPQKNNPDFHVKANSLRSEFVIKVKGKVQARPGNMQNPKLPTGKVELFALELDILSTSEELPFEISNYSDVGEETRLKYRYLDIRRPQVMNNFYFRHLLYQSIRNFLTKQDFIEFETPILTKSTPEGARDYLVPSRVNPGRFFALPQSPQLFKQILMVAGVDRYFQIAKCFRDEDLRADRQPEFTQLDMEMSFVTQEDIFSICENLFKIIFKDVLNIDLKTPFKRLTHAEAMQNYKSDKPDLRTDTEKFAFVWIVDFPLFKYNEEEKRLESEHHPFTSPMPQDLDKLDSKPLEVRSSSYDLVLNGNEIGSGSIRIHDRNLQEKIFKIIGISEEESKKRFGFLLESFKYGAPVHGGIAFGIDRLLTIFLDQPSIREVIAFPKTQKAVCPMTDAPSDVDKKQLKELKIKVE